MNDWPHREVPNSFVGDTPFYTCKCGVCFTNDTLMRDHLWNNREIIDGVMKCKECGEPQYFSTPEGCSGGQHYGDPNFEKLPQFPHPVNTPPIFGPTTLELAKAFRDCFKQTNGRIPHEPLDELITRYFGNLVFDVTPELPKGENNGE